MTTELKPCPCGRVPEYIDILEIRGNEILVSCDDERCGWQFIVRKPRPFLPDSKIEAIVRFAWNSAPRGE